MLNLTVESIKDFQICERLFDYRYNDKLPEKIYSRDIYAKKFESTIKNILYFFWYKKQGGITPSYSSLINRWEKLWFPKNIDSYDIITEQHESVYGNLASLSTKAEGIIREFFNKYSETELIPLAISEDYICVINKNIKIEDKFDLLYRYNNKNYVVKFMFNYKLNYSYMYQIDFATMYSGFKLRHPDRMHQTRFGYIDLLSNNMSFNEYDVSSEDVEALDYWCDTIYSKEIFVPKRGMTLHCKKCQFDDICSKWKFPN